MWYVRVNKTDFETNYSKELGDKVNRRGNKAVKKRSCISRHPAMQLVAIYRVVSAVVFLQPLSGKALETLDQSQKLYWGHKVIRAFPATESDLDMLSRLQHIESLEVDFWRQPSQVGSVVDIHVSSNDLKKLLSILKQYDIDYKVQISDLQAVLDKQNDVAYKSTPWHSIYHSLDQIEARMAAIAKSSSLVHMHSIGKSYESRDQHLIQIQSNPNSPKPLVFISCGMHAREWVSPATCMYMIDQMALEYGTNPSVTAMLNKVDLVIVPVVNVDGYVYSWTTDRLWRKNRKPNPRSKCVGTDLNRNWQFHWGGTGASVNPCHQDYRGSSSMSEIEVQNINNFLKSEQSRLVGLVDIHSYSQLWMLPWAYTKEKTKDNKELMRVGGITVQAIKASGFNTTYEVGSSSGLLYACSGSLLDYAYGSLGVKYSFGVELRDKGVFGFALPASLIQPTAKEMFEGLKAMVREMRI